MNRHDAASEDSPEPIDWTALLVSIDGNLETAREFASLFQDVGRTSLAGLLAALERGDLPSVAHSAHELKGACANLRASCAARAAERLEHAAKQNEARDLQRLASDLERQVRNAIDYLTKKVA
jgi:HPt (histidine-containing phosphotransfer) domain-containing protein